MKKTILTLMVYLTIVFIGACSVFWFNTKRSGRMSVQVFAAANQDGVYTLFKVSDTLAVKVYGDEVIGVSKFHEASGPFCFLCGDFEEIGQVLFQPVLQGDWMYTLQVGNSLKSDSMAFPALNLKTGEFLLLSSFEEIQRLGLNIDATYQTIQATELNRFNLETLPLEKSNCVYIMVAFVFLYAALGVWYIIAGLVARKPSP